MEKCLPRFLVTSLVALFLGAGLLWFGWNSQEGVYESPLPNPTASVSAVIGIDGQRVLVSKVVDGDTIVADGNKTVRLIGIDTPETKDPRRPVGCFGKEASNKTKELLLGKEVILQKDVSETDKYQRILRYIFLPLEDGTVLFVNDYLVREGFATVYTYPPDVKYNEQLRQAETEAKENNRGLWGRC